MSIRSTAKAVIINDKKVLLNKCFDKNNGSYYSLPGGGQNKYETLFEAVVRECREETGYTVKPIKLIGLCETICTDEAFRQTYPDYTHKMYHIFLCELSDKKQAAVLEKDDMQEYSEWIDIDSLSDIKLLPKILGEQITDILNGNSNVFFGVGIYKF